MVALGAGRGYTAFFLIAVGDVVAPPQNDLTYRGIGLGPGVGLKDTNIVMSVAPGGSADRAGLRVGDRLKLPPLLDLRLGVVRPDPLHALDERTGRAVVLVPNPPRAAFYRWGFSVQRVLDIAMALVIVLLRGRMWSGIALATFLASLGFTELYLSATFLGIWGGTLYELIQSPLTVVAGIAAAGFAASLTPPNAVRWIAWPLSVALGVIGIGYLIVEFTVNANGYADITTPMPINIYVAFLQALPILAMFFSGFRIATGVERRRIAIVAVCIVIGLSAGDYPIFGFDAIYGTGEQVAATVSYLIMSVGLLYAILVEHLFDIGFVLNRAVVFGAVTAIIVPLFIVVEFGAGRLAERIGHVQGVTLELAVAVTIGLSLRPLHDRVDRLVDTVLFAQRHRAVMAIERFAREAHFIADRRKLLDAVLWTLRTYARAAEVDILLRDDSGLFHSAADSLRVLDGDDLAAVRMRSSGEPVIGREYGVIGDGEIALPMLVRGELTGTILCKLEKHVEPYSPEEMHALRFLARDLAFALVSLDAAETQRLREEIALLRFGAIGNPASP